MVGYAYEYESGLLKSKDDAESLADEINLYARPEVREKDSGYVVVSGLGDEDEVAQLMWIESNWKFGRRANKKGSK